MNCLTNYIGLKHCSQDDPESGFYVNMLAGISTELADKIANEEQQNFQKLWEDIQDRAYFKLKNDISGFLLADAKADFKNVLYKTKKLLKKERNAVSIPASSEYRGVYFSLPESRYSKFRVTDLIVYSFQEEATELKIFDMNDGEELASIDVELQVGLNVIPINQVFELKYRVLELFIGIDASLIDTIETLGEYYHLDSCSSVFDGYHSPQIYPATLPISDDPLYDNLTLSGEGKGVVIGGEISCSIDEFICQNKHNFQQSWLYLLGTELLDQKLKGSIGSSRLNYFTVTNRELTAETKTQVERSYFSNLKRELKGIPIDNESVCFSCQDNLEVFTGGAIP